MSILMAGDVVGAEYDTQTVSQCLFYTVIPAKAGIYIFKSWIPAFAGMTKGNYDTV